MLFLSYFGLFCLVGMAILIFIVNKELKKQLPTEQEKQIMVTCGLISKDEKNKKILRSQCQLLRTFDFVYNNFENYPTLKKMLDNKQLNKSEPFNVKADNK